MNNNITVGSIWRDGARFVTVTAVDSEVVEYGYPHQEAVYYIFKENFSRNFSRVAENTKISQKEKDLLVEQLKTCLASIKEKNLGDHVYAMMEELGL